MFIILWEYQVRPEKQTEFESIYSPNGEWAELFKTGAGYLGTEIFQDVSHPLRYLIIDRWTSKENYEAFMRQQDDEYMSLDEQCKGLIESEALIGKWDTIDP